MQRLAITTPRTPRLSSSGTNAGSRIQIIQRVCFLGMPASFCVLVAAWMLLTASEPPRRPRHWRSQPWRARRTPQRCRDPRRARGRAWAKSRASPRQRRRQPTAARRRPKAGDRKAPGLETQGLSERSPLCGRGSRSQESRDISRGPRGTPAEEGEAAYNRRSC